MALLAEILAKIGGAALVHATVQFVKTTWPDLDASVRAFVPFSSKLYFQDLRSEIEKLPFIYFDVPFDILGTFVDVELTSHGFDAWDAQHARRRRDAVDVLRDSRKFLLLGEAGIGKTTLFRYVILCLMSKKHQKQILYPSEPRVIPIYVPLKTLDGRESYPILHYIQCSHRYFKGKPGLRRLVSLAKRRRLMLFLDGYDEIPIAIGASYIRRELGLLFTTHVPASDSDDSDPNHAFYMAFPGNRIGLSSRREFYLANPIAIPRGIAVLASIGLWDSRVQLVRHIFDRYRKNSPFFEDKLSEEVFMQQFYVIGDSALERLSHNPLFLTVLCYVYVNEIRQGNSLNDFWKRGELELIDRCIRLLLEDLDDDKARGLSDTQKQALMDRRSSFPAEKMEYLSYLAARALLDNHGVFTYGYLIQRAGAFFSAHPNEHTDLILKGLDSEDATGNIVVQIIFSGILVLVPLAPESRVFDFPHRRFKEVLAADYLDSFDGFATVCSRIHEPQLFEFILLYARRTGRIRGLIDAAIESLASKAQTYRAGDLLTQLLEHIPDANLRSQLVWHLITRISTEPRGKRLSRQLLNFLQYRPEYVDYLENLRHAAFDDRQQRSSMDAFVGLPLQYLRHSVSSRPATSFVTLVRDPHGMVATLLGSHGFDVSQFKSALEEIWPSRDLQEVDPRSASELLTILDTQDSQRHAKALLALTKHFGATARGTLDSGEVEKILRQTAAWDLVIESTLQAVTDDQPATFAWM